MRQTVMVLYSVRVPGPTAPYSRQMPPERAVETDPVALVVVGDDDQDGRALGVSNASVVEVANAYFRERPDIPPATRLALT
ncbi:hypothetical protein ABT116_27580, partial [Streptomyces sp. NPDC002130]